MEILFNDKSRNYFKECEDKGMPLVYINIYCKNNKKCKTGHINYDFLSIPYKLASEGVDEINKVLDKIYGPENLISTDYAKVGCTGYWSKRTDIEALKKYGDEFERIVLNTDYWFKESQ